MKNWLRNDDFLEPIISKKDPNGGSFLQTQASRFLHYTFLNLTIPS